jgi:Tol biopolymer transport system component
MKRLLAAFLLMGFFVSCQTGEKKQTAKLPPAAPDPYPSEQITYLGTNSQATVSSDGLKVVFVSRQRDGHENHQLYLMDLAKNQESRISHQDGDVAFPVFHPKRDLVLFSSTTDEVKESPDISSIISSSDVGEKTHTDPILWPTDLYATNIDGSRMWRISRHKGFDGLASFHPRGRLVAFTTSRYGKKALLTVMVKGKRAKRLLKKRCD